MKNTRIHEYNLIIKTGTRYKFTWTQQINHTPEHSYWCQTRATKGPSHFNCHCACKTSLDIPLPIPHNCDSAICCSLHRRTHRETERDADRAISPHEGKTKSYLRNFVGNLQLLLAVSCSSRKILLKRAALSVPPTFLPGYWGHPCMELSGQYIILYPNDKFVYWYIIEMY